MSVDHLEWIDQEYLSAHPREMLMIGLRTEQLSDLAAMLSIQANLLSRHGREDLAVLLSRRAVQLKDVAHSLDNDGATASQPSARKASLLSNL